MACISPTLEGWVYIDPIHGPLYAWAQYTPTILFHSNDLILSFMF